MKLSETNLYEVTAKYVSYRTRLVRIPKVYDDTYELTELIESAVYDEELELSECYEESLELTDVDVGLIQDYELDNCSDRRRVTTDVLISSDGNIQNIESLQLTQIDDISDVKNAKN